MQPRLEAAMAVQVAKKSQTKMKNSMADLLTDTSHPAAQGPAIASVSRRGDLPLPAVAPLSGVERTCGGTLPSAAAFSSAPGPVMGAFQPQNGGAVRRGSPRPQAALAA